MQSHKSAHIHCTLNKLYVDYMELGVCNTLLTFCGAHENDHFILIVAIVGLLLIIHRFSYIQHHRNFKLIFVGGNFSRYYQNKMILLLIIMRSVLTR